MMRTTYLYPALACAALIITGCTSTSRALGLEKSAPNEFNILTKAPLIVPPEYNLRPPAIGASSSENNYTQKSAREALLGDIDPAEPSNGEIALMAQAGVNRANPEIRIEIDGANSVERKSDGFTDRVLFWQNGSVLDAQGNPAPLNAETEARRLESVNSATGGGQVTISKRPGGAKLPGL
jgi:hypothetical protein